MQALPLIDCQSHLIPPFLFDLINEHGTSQLSATLVSPVDSGPGADPNILVTFDQRFSLLLRSADLTPSAAIQRMDKCSISTSVISLNMPGAELFAPDAQLDVAQRCNDWLASTCEESLGRLVGIAQLPWLDLDASLHEIERAINMLNMRGFLLPSNIAGNPVDAERFLPVYEEVAARNVPLLIHPAHPGWSAEIIDYSMVPMLGFMTDSSIAALRLILSGISQQVPNLKIVHPHCGGVLPWLIPRVEEQTETKGRGREHISERPGLLYRDFYIDLQAPSKEQITWVADHSRPDRLLFATDAPWVDSKLMIDLFMAAEMDEETRARAAWRNASELFNIAVTEK